MGPLGRSDERIGQYNGEKGGVKRTVRRRNSFTRATAFSPGQEFEQVVVVPRGVEPLALDATVLGLLPVQQVKRDPSQAAEVLAEWPLRWRAWSSSKPTSSTQCRLFSTDQCPRMRSAIAAASTPPWLLM